MWLSLLHITRPELGHTIEKDGSRAGAPDKHTVGMHLFVERGIQGGISMVSKRYRKANNLLNQNNIFAFKLIKYPVFANG